MNLLNQLEKWGFRALASGDILLSIVKLEARLAGLSLGPLLLSLIFLFVVSITLWIAVMVLAGYFFTWASGRLWIGILCVIFLNLLVAGLLIYSAISNIKMMSFQKTRKLLKPENRHD